MTTMPTGWQAKDGALTRVGAGADIVTAQQYAGFDLTLKATGDLDVDAHHTVEDVGIALGEAVAQAVGNKRGINRAGYFVMPMDESIGVVAIDLGGRAHSVVDARVRTRLVGDLQADLLTDFFEGFARGARANVHLKVLYGRSDHHKVEALFKAFGRALRRSTVCRQPSVSGRPRRTCSSPRADASSSC